ncbi:unnamed protein product [Ceutorhynchus assimilis]|uniref:CDT1 Geminin-binding domain-containing protein n=1 Tax=Ceutorhynchus assimilis TaxID=467358 RepID=A0A9P0DJ02_9CUCU|nr:unnamed protein product [Ceutorhynchus assimilis]
MAQPSVACFFKNRKRTALEDTKIIQVPQKTLGSDECPREKLTKLQEKEETFVVRVASEGTKNVQKKVLKAARGRKPKPETNSKDIQELFNKIKKAQATEKPSEPGEKPFLPPTRRGLAELRASMARFKEGEKKLAEIEKKTSQITPESPRLKGFKTIELEVQTSPRKLFSPEKAYLSPKKDISGVRKNLLNLLSPTKNAISIPQQTISKELLSETSKPALTLPFKYRFLAEMFRAVDTISQLMFNRKETITFRKLKPAVEEMLKRNLFEKHLAQFKTVFPEAFDFTQEKLKIYGCGMRAEQWELVVKPNVKDNESMTSNFLLERRRKFFNILLDKVKDCHDEFLATLDSPIRIPKDKVTRWHPEFDLEKVPDIGLSPLPQPPADDKLTSGKDVLERARSLFNCNTRLEQAMKKLNDAKQTQTPLPIKEIPKDMPQSVLKGIPKGLLEKVRQKQAAKALLSMTRSADKEKEVQLYSRLPEIARLSRNLFVSEKKGVLPLEIVLDKLELCYRGNLTRSEMEEHLKAISKELPNWLIFHDIRNCVYIKLNKNADVSLVVSKLEGLCKTKNES